MGKAIVLACLAFLFLDREITTHAAESNYLLSEGFEGTGFENPGWTKFGDPDEDYSEIALHGSQSLNCVGHQQIFRAFSASNSFNLYMKMRLTTIPSFQGLLFWRNNLINTVAEMYMNNGSVELIHGHVIHTSASIFTTNITYDVWIEWTKGDGTNGTMKLFVATNGYKPSLPQLEIIDGNGGAIDRFDLGPEGVGGNVIFDRLLYAATPIGSNPGGNVPPTISEVPQQVIEPDTTTGPIPFVVTDLETPAESLVVSASSSNPTLVPNADIALAGSDSNRTVTVTPAPGREGSAVIQLTVSDGQDTSSTSFTVVVAPTNSAHTFLLSEGFEGSGFENSGWTKVGNPNEDYGTQPLHGSQSLYTLGSQRIIRSFSYGDSLSFYFKVRFISLPTFQSLIDWQRSDTDLNIMAQIYINGGVVTLGHGTSHVIGNTPLTTNITYDIWIDWTKGTGANGTMQLFIATDGVKPVTPEVDISDGTGGTLGRIVMGPQLSGEVIFDRLLIDNIPIGNAPAGNHNDAPFISDVGNQIIFANSSTSAIGFTVGDAETPAAALTLTVSSSNPTLIPGDGITFDGSGSDRTVTVTPAVDQYGSAIISLVVNDGILSATDSFLVTVTAGELTVTVDDASRSYGAVNPTFTGSITGLQAGDDISLVLDSPATPESPVGSYPITVSFNDPDNKLNHYTVVTNNGSLTVSRASLDVTAADAIRAYGSPNPLLTGSIVGLKNSDNITASYTTSATADSPVGSYVITPALNDPDDKLGNYTVVLHDGRLSVIPARLTITANDATRVYDGLAFNGGNEVSYLGFVNGETASVLSGTLSYGGTSQGAINVGSYTIIPNGLSSGNYTISYVNGTLSINKAALLVKAVDASRVFGQTNPVFSATFTGLVNGEQTNVLGGDLVLSTTAETNSPVGTYPIEVSGVTSDNYEITFQDGVLTVTPYALTVKADDKAKVYGESDPAFTVSYTGFVNGDTESVLGGTLSFSRAPGEAVGSYLITPSGLTSTNYAITFATGNLTITKAALTVTAADATRVYGDANPVFTGTLAGVAAGDNITAIYATSADASSPVGTYAIVPAFQDPDSKLNNYNVTVINGTLILEPGALSVMADDKSRSYGAPNPPFTGTITGIRNGDDLTLDLSTSATASSPPGIYEIVPSLNDPANKLGNYTVTAANGTLTIRPAGVTGIAIVGNHARIAGSADAGAVFKIEASTDLSSWTEAGRVTVAADGSFELIDPDTATLEARFYRAVAP